MRAVALPSTVAMGVAFLLLLVSYGVSSERGGEGEATVQRTAGILAFWNWGQITIDTGDFEESQYSTPVFKVLMLTMFLYSFIAFSLFNCAAAWVLYAKADEPGWASLIPIYGVVVLCRMLEKPWWWAVLFHVPIAVTQIVIGIIFCIDVARYFGRSVLFGIGIIFLPFIFVPIIAFGDDEYGSPESA